MIFIVEIHGFPNYRYDTKLDVVIDTINGNKILKEMKLGVGTTAFKMKNEAGKWVSVSRKVLLSKIKTKFIPDTSWKEVVRPNSGYYINRNGQVMSIKRYSCGELMNVYIPKNSKKYPAVTLRIDGCSKPYPIHKLLAKAFIDSDYIEKGLCVLHIDNNKHNFKLSNLKVGTYSENNKQAY